MNDNYRGRLMERKKRNEKTSMILKKMLKKELDYLIWAINIDPDHELPKYRDKLKERDKI